MIEIFICIISLGVNNMYSFSFSLWNYECFKLWVWCFQVIQFIREERTCYILAIEYPNYHRPRQNKIGVPRNLSLESLTQRTCQSKAEIPQIFPRILPSLGYKSQSIMYTEQYHQHSVNGASWSVHLWESFKGVKDLSALRINSKIIGSLPKCISLSWLWHPSPWQFCQSIWSSGTF